MNCAIYWFRVFSVSFAIIYTFGYIGTDGKYTLFPLLPLSQFYPHSHFLWQVFVIQNQCKIRFIVILFLATHCYRAVSIWVQTLTCCLTTPSHYLEHCRFVMRHSPKSNNTVIALENNHCNPFENYTFHIQHIWCSDMHCYWCVIILPRVAMTVVCW